MSNKNNQINRIIRQINNPNTPNVVVSIPPNSPSRLALPIQDNSFLSVPLHGRASESRPALNYNRMNNNNSKKGGIYRKTKRRIFRKTKRSSKKSKRSSKRRSFRKM